MDVLLFCLALVGLAVFVAAPLYGRSAAGPPAVRPPRDTDPLLDLEVDRASGLIDPSTYEAERREIERDD